MAYQNRNNFPKKIFKGEWHCAQCQKVINELPFNPDPNKLDRLLCRDCYQSKKNFFRN